MRRSLLVTVAAATLVLSACGSADSSAPQPAATPAASAVNVVATTTMLGDVVGQILSCAGGTVTVLMPAGTDPHDFSASSDQVAAMVTANLVVANGLGLEAGLTDAFENAAADGAKVFEVGPLVDPIEFGAGAHEEGHEEEGHEEEGHEHGSLDPHFWFDMNRMALAAELIGAELAESTGDGAYATCATTTAANIRTAEAGVRTALESVPADQRILVTDHEALGYLADTYGYEIAGTVIPSGTTLAEPSSADLAALVATIKAEGVTAIFANVAQTTGLAEAVAAETGTPIKIIPLYVESLGAPDSPAATYLQMMQTNADLIASGLKG
jgi:zinc/manganese transport system substrate-binding protein